MLELSVAERVHRVEDAYANWYGTALNAEVALTREHRPT